MSRYSVVCLRWIYYMHIARTYVSTLQRANFSENSRRRIDRISRCFLASVKVKYSTEVNGLTQQRYGDATSGWSVPL